MIKRSLLTTLRKHLEQKEMMILVGPRQAGKTFLMKVLEKELIEKGERTVFLSLDNEEQRTFFQSQSELVAFLKLRAGNLKLFVFIDEIQKKESAEEFLKGLYDMDLPFKFIVSGSGSLELKAKIKESMAGRKRLFAVNPVSFREFVNFKTDYQFEDRLEEFFGIEQERGARLLEEYMTYGGYPRVILAPSIAEKNEVISEIYESYVERDIKALLSVEKDEALTKLVKLIAGQIGGLVNVSELASTLDVSVQTVKLYLWYLEKTFILRKVTPFYRNIRKEISKAPVYYFVDLGLRNWLLGLFGLPQILPPLAGHLFENVVFNMLGEQIFPPVEVHFWRTRDQAEVDFVIVRGMEIFPMEVKYSKVLGPEVSRSLLSFLKKYGPKQGFVVHLGGEFVAETLGTEMRFVPYFKTLDLGVDI